MSLKALWTVLLCVIVVQSPFEGQNIFSHWFGNGNDEKKMSPNEKHNEAIGRSSKLVQAATIRSHDDINISLDKVFKWHLERITLPIKSKMKALDPKDVKNRLEKKMSKEIQSRKL
ncbi:unnamed protein product [Thelazia callipaeda]|uniref:Uncharacterized protein n=1 Tax=Thelazia callipaeda TaxID=103827 RepID=A0A0N5CXB6_THECL|nr:unnamed protein product [Thelazia callipaeda]